MGRMGRFGLWNTGLNAADSVLTQSGLRFPNPEPENEIEWQSVRQRLSVLQ